jgi:CheY-like chemotaxis protein
MARVLLVDDDPICRAIGVEALAQEGHLCEEAEDGEAATDRLARQAFDLVVTDLLMPNKEGIETILEIKRMWPSVKVIAMSGGSSTATSDQLLQMAARLGADATLSKPLRAEALRDAARRLLQA